MTTSVGQTAVAVGPSSVAPPESERDLRGLREAFQRHHWARLPGLLRGELLERIQRQVREGEFAERTHTTAHTELTLETSKALGLLALLTNDPALFEVIRHITGCDRIGKYGGRVYRMLPGAKHEGTWHNDLLRGRMVAMSINLSEARYSGGVLEIRDHDSKEFLQRATNDGFGDALIFRIDPALEHRLTAVEGEAPKTAYAGWFMSGEDSELARPRALFSDATETTGGR